MLITSLLVFGLVSTAQPAYAYPEYPPFEQTRFADGHGMYRYWESCWWKVFDPYVYLQCEPNGTILLVLPDGTVVEATPEQLDYLFSFFGGMPRFNAPGTSGSRLGVLRSSHRNTAAPGDGIRLSDYYGGGFNRFDGFGSSFGVSSFDGFSFSGPNLPSGIGENEFGVFRFNADGSLDRSGSTFRFSGSDDSNGSQRIFGQNVRSSNGGDTGAFSGGDGFFSENNLRSRMDDFFYEPVGLIGCDSIYDSKDGGIFGPIPCTSYPGVFGPVPRY